jgi:hypothetical protein
MNKQLTDQLIEKYPQLFSHYQFLECDDGWYDLIDRLSWQIDQHCKWKDKVEQEDEDKEQEEERIYFVQIKEKFGTLRAYLNQQDECISGLVSMAESISATICEVCGEKGKSRKSGWIKTLCEKHHIENQQRKNNEKEV